MVFFTSLWKGRGLRQDVYVLMRLGLKVGLSENLLKDDVHRTEFKICYKVVHGCEITKKMIQGREQIETYSTPLSFL